MTCSYRGVWSFGSCLPALLAVDLMAACIFGRGWLLGLSWFGAKVRLFMLIKMVS